LAAARPLHRPALPLAFELPAVDRTPLGGDPNSIVWLGLNIAPAMWS